MSYPNNIDLFNDKLNKKQDGSTYVIEEEITLTDGVFEGILKHDNIVVESIVIYTEPAFNGEKVENYFISTPSETPWKKELKVFADKPKLYVVYETTGDQVEAEDINLVQDAITNTQTEIERYKTENNQTVIDIEERVTDVEEVKADKTYVDTELNKKYDKNEVFTKEEVLQKIEDIIDAAPEALDTLGKIADALNKDPDFAATITSELATKVDKVAGKKLSTEDYSTAEKQKLAGIESNANKYTHPSTHPANIIVETPDKRFVSDAEKAEWDAKETPANAQAKADIAENNAKEYADSIKPIKVSQLINDKNFVTESDIEGLGVGDMLKSVYDTNNNGKVDVAENAEKLGGKSPNEYMLTGPKTWNDLKGV